MTPGKYILEKLVRKRCWGGVHKPERRVLRWVKTMQDRRAFVKEYKGFIRNEWIIRERKTQEWHISLNIRKKAEILDYIKK